MARYRLLKPHYLAPVGQLCQLIGPAEDVEPADTFVPTPDMIPLDDAAKYSAAFADLHKRCGSLLEPTNEIETAIYNFHFKRLTRRHPSELPKGGVGQI
jgi:hypothetical protein